MKEIDAIPFRHGATHGGKLLAHCNVAVDEVWGELCNPHRERGAQKASGVPVFGDWVRH